MLPAFWAGSETTYSSIAGKTKILIITEILNKPPHHHQRGVGVAAA